MRNILSIASYVILAFGFFYMSWQVGRAYAAAENAETEDCAVYIELIDELAQLSGNYEIHTKYKEYQDQ